MKRNARILAFALLLLGAGFLVGYRVREAYPPKRPERIQTEEERAESARIQDAMWKARLLASFALRFADEHDLILPRSFDDLRGMPGVDQDLFRSPYATEQDKCGFELHHPGKNLALFELPRTTEPLVSVSHLRNDEERIVVFLDGHVEWMRELDFIRWRLKQGPLATNKLPKSEGTNADPLMNKGAP